MIEDRDPGDEDRGEPCPLDAGVWTDAHNLVLNDADCERLAAALNDDSGPTPAMVALFTDEHSLRHGGRPR